MIFSAEFRSSLKLSSSRTMLTPATPELANDRYLAWLQDPNINRFLETRWQQQSIESIRNFIAARYDDPNSMLFAIVDNKNHQHIGNIKLGPINWDHGFSELSYFIGERTYWGCGLATEVIETVVDWGLNELNLYMIKAGIYETNIASQKVLEKAGFRFEARFSGELVDAEGRRTDHLWYTKKNNKLG